MRTVSKPASVRGCLIEALRAVRARLSQPDYGVDGKPEVMARISGLIVALESIRC